MTTATPPVALRGAHVHHHLRGGHGRLRHRLLLFFAIGFAVLVGLGALGAVLGAPTRPLCRPYHPCRPPTVVRPLVNETVWRSSQYGFALEYPGNLFSVARQDAGGVTLEGAGGALLIRGFSRAAPAQAIVREIESLNGVTQVALDTNPADQLLGAGVGRRLGAGRIFIGDLSSPQGPGQQVALASEASSDGPVTVIAIVASPVAQAGPNSGLWQLGDLIINSIRWPTNGS